MVAKEGGVSRSVQRMVGEAGRRHKTETEGDQEEMPENKAYSIGP